MISLSLSTSFKSSVNIVNALGSSCETGVVMPSSPSNTLAVILVHGYAEDSGVWSKWEPLLKNEHIPYCTVSFRNDDECGNAIAHANEPNQMVLRVKLLTHQDKVNIIGHSKGGLDARVYLAQNPTRDVANLIMIGTPNGGSPLADFTTYFNVLNPWLYYTSFFCTPALYDLETGASDTRVRENPYTNYYTIYGDWKPSLPCRNHGLEIYGYPFLYKLGPNDGIVLKKSVESLTNFTKLGYTFHCHTDLLSSQEFNISKNVLTSGN